MKRGDKAEATLHKYKTPGLYYVKKVDKAEANIRKSRGTNQGSKTPKTSRTKSQRIY